MSGFTDVLKSVAPGLATALLGPLGGLAVSAIGSALSIPEPTQEKIQNAMAGVTQEDLLKLKQADQQFTKDMKALDIDVFKAEVDDRKSARDAAVRGGYANELFWLSLFLLIACIGGEMTVLFYGYPKTVPDVLVGRILGLMDAVTMMVLAYYYGTTKGSQAKDTTISAMAAK